MIICLQFLLRGFFQKKCSIHTNRIGEGIKRLPAGFTKVLQTKVFEAVRTLEQVNPEATEVCDNELDDDCDGEIDEGYLPPICNLSDRRRGRRIGVFNDPSRSNPLYSGQFGSILASDPDSGPREWPQFARSRLELPGTIVTTTHLHDRRKTLIGGRSKHILKTGYRMKERDR